MVRAQSRSISAGVLAMAEEAARTSNSACVWIAEATVDGRTLHASWGGAGETGSTIATSFLGWQNRKESNFTYAEASWTQALADWIGAHNRASQTPLIVLAGSRNKSLHCVQPIALSVNLQIPS